MRPPSDGGLKVPGKKEEDESSIKSRLNKRQALEATKKKISHNYYYFLLLKFLVEFSLKFFLTSVVLLY